MGKEASKSFGKNYRHPSKSLQHSESLPFSTSLLDAHNIITSSSPIFQNQARSRMMKRKSTDETPSYWDNLWGQQNDYKKSGKINSLKLFLWIIIITIFVIKEAKDLISMSVTEEEVQERAQRAAAAARRWREYSRRGVDKRPSFKLPDSASRGEN